MNIYDKSPMNYTGGKYRLLPQIMEYFPKDVNVMVDLFAGGCDVCSNFKANFNAKTGNVEATATFVGYTWSLLTDIPLAYLIAAPYCNYEGASYWAAHENDEEWQMDNTDQSNATMSTPPKLYEFFKAIRECIKESPDIASGGSSNSSVSSSISDERGILNEIKTSDFYNLEKISFKPADIYDYNKTFSSKINSYCTLLLEAEVTDAINKYNIKVNGYDAVKNNLIRARDDLSTDALRLENRLLFNSSYFWTTDTVRNTIYNYTSDVFFTNLSNYSRLTSVIEESSIWYVNEFGGNR